jgi:hypothetical protein
MSSLAIGEYYPISTASQKTQYGGNSAEARKLYKEMNALLIRIKPSEQQWVFNELEELRNIASYPNWDNLGSRQLDADTYEIAKRFILALPSSLPAPELTVDRDGEVNFDWFSSGGQVFSASLRKDGRIAYAGQISTRKRFSGLDEFNDSIPKKIVESIKSIFSR